MRAIAIFAPMAARCIGLNELVTAFQHLDLAISPNSMPADAHPFAELEIGHEFAEFALIFSFTDETADRMPLA